MPTYCPDSGEYSARYVYFSMAPIFTSRSDNQGRDIAGDIRFGEMRMVGKGRVCGP
jgi:hypothetical protein